MPESFGKLRPCNVEKPVQRYRQLRSELDRRDAEPAIDHAFAWLSYFIVVFCTVTAFTPDVAVAAVCTVYDCGLVAKN